MSREARLRLAFLGLHPERLRAWEERWGSPQALVRALGRPGSALPSGLRAHLEVPARTRREELASLGVEARFRGDPGYPSHLASLPDAPEVLFCRGRLPEGPGVAVVGARAASTYGLRLAFRFGEAVGRAGWPVVSGLARGVDGASHRGLLEAGGVGVAVLGSGPDLWYPPEHRRLGEALVAAGGAVVTEYPPGTPPEAWRFPARNRIISGLAQVVVVVEAGERGGALITARAALDQGRAVFVVPGDVDRDTSRGCNLLIRDGAHPVLGADDLVEELSLVLGPPPRHQAEQAPEDPLLAALGEVGRPLEELASALGMPAPELLAAVARLEAEGRVRVEGGSVARS